MLNKEEFIQAVQDNLVARNGDLVINPRTMQKNNGVEKTFLDVKYPDSLIAPSVPMDDAYEAYASGMDINKICDKIFSSLSFSKNNAFDINTIMNPVYFNDNVVTRVVNSDKNYDMLLNAPYKSIKGFNDLVLVGRLEVTMPDGHQGSILVTEDILSRVGVSAKEMFDMAQSNTERLHPAKIQSMSSQLAELTGMPEFVFEDTPPMYVVSNVGNTNGANVLTYDGIFERIRSELGGDFYILPSSIHEFIVLPKSFGKEIGEENLNNMVREINAAVVSPEEVLSDSIYSYNSNTKAISTVYTEASQSIGIDDENMRDMNENYESLF